jgi:Nickel responsive protein SCO4226-like
VGDVPIYVIERRFAEAIDVSADDVTEIEAVNADENVQWIFSFLTVDRMRTYCLYEAPSPDALRTAARRLNIPADAIVEVSQVSAESIRTQAAAV